MTDNYYLAHLNAVKPTGPLSPDDPDVLFFFSQLMKIVQLAQTSPGLRWHDHAARLPDGNYLKPQEFMSLRTGDSKDNPHVITMAGWESVEALHGFTYRLPDHVEGMKKLRSWVNRAEGATMVMWWQPRGGKVSMETGWAKLEQLRSEGPSPEAFNLQTRFERPGVPVSRTGEA